MPESALKLLKSSLALEADSWCLRKQDFGMPLEELKTQLSERVEGTQYAGALIGFDSTLGADAIEHARTVLEATKAHFTTKRIAIAGSGFMAAAEDGLFPLSFFASYKEELTEFLLPFKDPVYPRFFMWDKRPSPNERELLSQFCMK